MMLTGSRNLLELGASEWHLLKARRFAKVYLFPSFSPPFISPAVSVESVVGCCDNSRRLLWGACSKQLSGVYWQDLSEDQERHVVVHLNFFG